MGTTLIQFRADEDEKAEAMRICEQLGISLPTYLRMCLARLIREQGIPFSMRLGEDNPGVDAMKRASAMAKRAGVTYMSLDDINAEVDAVRNSSGE